jgi:hypothetical protein
MSTRKTKSKGLKNRKKKGKKVSFMLSEHDAMILAAEAAKQHAPCSVTAKRMLHLQLRQCAQLQAEIIADNQLNIFDSVQIDIFNNTSKPKKEKTEVKQCASK